MQLGTTAVVLFFEVAALIWAYQTVSALEVGKLSSRLCIFYFLLRELSITSWGIL